MKTIDVPRDRHRFTEYRLVVRGDGEISDVRTILDRGGGTPWALGVAVLVALIASLPLFYALLRS